MKKLILPLISCLIAMLMFPGCYSDNEYDLYPFTPCDSVNVTYAKTISPIMMNNCNVCHSTALANGGVVTDNYASLSIVAQNGKLWGAVSHTSGFIPMPQNGTQLSSCDLGKIRQWINTGSPNN